jgi:protocatechuate 3,4-dioxygenase beta subunit
MRPTALIGLVFAGAVAAAEPAEWTYPVTHQGKPAAGVKVGMTAIDPSADSLKPSEPTFATTDAKGEVRFKKPAGESALARVLARDQAGRGGFGTLYGEGRYPQTLELVGNAELAGRVLDDAGKPITGLKLKAVALGPESFAQYGGRRLVFVETPDWFWADFPAKVAADGSFTLPGVPVGYSAVVRFEAAGFGSGSFWVSPGQSTAVALRRSGAIRVTLPADAKGAVRVVVGRVDDKDGLTAKADGEVKAEAELALKDLPPGEYRLSFPYRRSTSYPKAVAAVTVKSGEPADVKLALEPAVTVTARLVDAKTEKGVPGARIYVGVTRSSGEFLAVSDATADGDGKVELPVPAGAVYTQPTGKTGYAIRQFGAGPFRQNVTEPVPLAAGKTHDFGTFTLVPTVELQGVVVGDDGKPVAEAVVQVGYSGSNSGTVSGPTDAQGRFTVRGLNPEGGVVGLTARKGDAITVAPLAVDPGKPDGELRLVISAQHAARLRIRAVGRNGKPFAGAAIELMHSKMFLSRGSGAIGGGVGGKVGVTGDDGRFTSDALQPGDQYTPTVSAPGYRPVPSAQWTAKAGETHDFGDVVLIQADLAVTGTVIDLAGKPVAGATVFDNADGPKPTQTKTDAAGKFTLGGLYAEPGFVSVRADGFRLASVPAIPGSPAVTVTLRRLTDPPAAPPKVSDEQKKATEELTRHLLRAMWQNRVAAEDDGKSTVRAMTRIDVATARKWVDEEKKRTDGKTDLSGEIEAALRDRDLLKTATEDVDEAIAVLKPVGDVEGFRQVCALAERLLPDAPDKAARLAEEAVARARGLEEAQRLWTLAQAGELVFRAGNPAGGRKLIEEAVKLAAPVGTDGLDSYRRGMVACRVALYDPAVARKMIDPIKEASEFNRWLAQGCVRAATHDLPTAKKWFAEFRPDNSFTKSSARQQVAYRIARTKPDDAIDIARGIEDRTLRATALAGLTTRLTDRDRAAKLFDEALDRIVADPTGYYNGGGGGTAAVVLFRAKQFGHPDLAALRDKVLAARAPMTGQNGMDSDDTFALALGLTDPDTAKALLARSLPDAERAKLDGGRRREALVALAVCDPAGAKTAADGVLARAVAAKKGYDYTGLDTLAKLLSRPDRPQETAFAAGRLLVDLGEE